MMFIKVLGFARRHWVIFAAITVILAYTTFVYQYAQGVIERKTLEAELKEAREYTERLESVLNENSERIQEILIQNASDIEELTKTPDTGDVSRELNNAINILRRREQ